MDIDSATSSPRVISQFQVTDPGSLRSVNNLATKQGKTAEISRLLADADGSSGASKSDQEKASGQLFAWCLYNLPSVALKPATMTALFADVKPTSVRSFVELLPSGERQVLRQSIKLGSKTYLDVPVSDLIEKLSKSDVLGKVFKGASATTRWTPPPIDVNDDNLNLLLLQPTITKIVMEKRKRDTELMLARATPLVAGPMGPMGPEVFLRLSSSMSGGADLDPSIPVEMRGAGPMLASMKAGFFNGLAIGTGSFPTQWRPVSDVLFISGQLRDAYDTLVGRIEKLTGKNNVLSGTVKSQVDSAISNLERAEKKVKESRDQLTKYNEIISSGQSKLSSRSGVASVTPATIKQSVEIYNDAQKERHKYEMKVFRVISTLGLKLESMA